MPEITSIEDPDGNEHINAEPPAETPEEEIVITQDTELFDGGPTKAVIDEWKTKFGKVYVTEVAENEYVIWRTLRRAEYRQLVDAMEKLIADGASNAEATMTNEEAMTKMCVLWPDLTATKIAADLAGMPSIISQQIMEASGFLSLQVREL